MTSQPVEGGAAAGALPHSARLVRRLLALEGPLIQLWAWPGSGTNGLLRALCDRLGPLAYPLSEAEMRAAPTGEPVLAAGRARGCRWFVALSLPPGALEALAPRLAPGERLVFAGWRRREVPGLEVERTPPGEALLRQEEILALLEHRLERPPGEPERRLARALHAATDGWYRPLLEVLPAGSAEVGWTELETATPDELAARPGVRAFLQHEVAALWSTEEAGQLARLAGRTGEREGVVPVDWGLGYWLEPGTTGRLPRLLAAHLGGRSHPDPVPDPSVLPAGRPRSRVGKSPPPVPTYCVVLFGPPEIHLRRSGDDRPIECRLRRSLQAFAYLASSPELRANRDQLIAAIWPNEGERTIDRNFHPTLSHLRRALEGGEEAGEAAPILFRNGIYQLNPDLGWEVDTREFQALADGGRRRLLAGDLEGAAADWRGAWSLYRGPYLQGFFDLWIAERREQLQQQYLELLRDFGDLCIRLERVEEALDSYRAVLSDDPLQERVQVAVMRLYAAQGRRDLVKRQYERLCSLLLEELGVAPLAQTTEDYHRLMV